MKLIPEITRNNFEEVKQSLSGSKDVDVTGGMFGKISELLDLAKQGIESQIVSALKEDYVSRALKGEKIGTVVKW